MSNDAFVLFVEILRLFLQIGSVKYVFVSESIYLKCQKSFNNSDVQSVSAMKSVAVGQKWSMKP